MKIPIRFNHNRPYRVVNVRDDRVEAATAVRGSWR